LSFDDLFFGLLKHPKLKKAKIKKQSKKTVFSRHATFGIELFSTPYYVFFCKYHTSSYDFFPLNCPLSLTLVTGVVLGPSIVFYFTSGFFKKIESKAGHLLRNMNIIIGSITS
jgi:hypothetical protein